MCYLGTLGAQATGSETEITKQGDVLIRTVKRTVDKRIYTWNTGTHLDSNVPRKI